MFKQQIIDKISQQISAIVKTSPLNDLENNLKVILQAALAKLDLVNREEFDIQQKVLLQTRIQLEKLEQIVAQLEQQTKKQ